MIASKLRSAGGRRRRLNGMPWHITTSFMNTLIAPESVMPMSLKIASASRFFAESTRAVIVVVIHLPCFVSCTHTIIARTLRMCNRDMSSVAQTSAAWKAAFPVGGRNKLRPSRAAHGEPPSGRRILPRSADHDRRPRRRHLDRERRGVRGALAVGDGQLQHVRALGRCGEHRLAGRCVAE